MTIRGNWYMSSNWYANGLCRGEGMGSMCGRHEPTQKSVPTTDAPGLHNVRRQRVSATCVGNVPWPGPSGRKPKRAPSLGPRDRRHERALLPRLEGPGGERGIPNLGTWYRNGPHRCDPVVDTMIVDIVTVDTVTVNTMIMDTTRASPEDSFRREPSGGLTPPR